ncbi:hypothetical protein Tco_1116333, partial [Tanacetum coccineum]
MITVNVGEDVNMKIISFAQQGSREDIELAKKASELKKEEIAAKLKEQWWLEEKAKATEALGGRNEMLKRPKLGLTFELRKKLRNKR